LNGCMPSVISRSCKDFFHRELVKFPNHKNSTLRSSWKTLFKQLYPPPMLGPDLTHAYLRRDDQPRVQDVNNVRTAVKESMRLHKDQSEAVQIYVDKYGKNVPFTQRHITAVCTMEGCTSMGTHSITDKSTDVRCSKHAETTNKLTTKGVSFSFPTSFPNPVHLPSTQT
jgi:hypothetical protein